MLTREKIITNSGKWVDACKRAFTKTRDGINMETAGDMVKHCAYAFDHCDENGENPVNWADAEAFFLEGYIKALEDFRLNVRLEMWEEQKGSEE